MEFQDFSVHELVERVCSAKSGPRSGFVQRLAHGPSAEIHTCFFVYPG